MAEVNTNAGSNRRRGVVRSKKLSTRVDLTPMVDLGFLLITFFVFTTTVSEPRAVHMKMPADTEVDTNIKESTALTIIPIANDQVLYYHGLLADAEARGRFGVTNFSVSKGIGAIIRQKQKMLEQSGVNRNDLMIVIRPADNCRYQNVVDALDEMFINAVARYAMADLTGPEKIFLQAHAIQ